MSTSDKPPRASEPLPTFDESAEQEEHAHEQHAHPHHAGEQQYYEDEEHYDEHGQPYADEQAYDENGQPYSDDQAYDEHGQPYGDEVYGEGEEGHYSGDAPTQQIDAYPTVPTFTGPPAPMPPSSRGPFARYPLGASPHGGPYRIPVAPEPATLPQSFKTGLLPAKPRPFLGSALAIYGVLLWSFVVAGQFATSWMTGSPMSNGTAMLIVFAATIAAWVLAMRRTRVAVPAMTAAEGVGRGVLMLAAATLMFFLTLIVATIIGQTSSRNHDFAIAFFLVVTAVAATILGPRLTLPARPERSHGARFALVSMWIMGAIVTFIAGAELATNG